MSRWMLDTGTISFVMRGYGDAVDHLRRHQRSEIVMSSITLAELRFGAVRRRSQKLDAMIATISRTVTILPFDEAAALAYGSLAATLRSRGTPIGEFDTLIAAHALSIHAILVTNNTKHFARVAGLKVENWA